MKSRLLTLLVAVGIFVFARLAYSQTTAQTADIPRIISYQALLDDQSGKPVADGIHSITIRLYSDPSGSTPAVWEDNFDATTIGGVFSILLGSNRPLPDAASMSGPLWLAVAVGPEKTELHPFAELTASPYAMTVANGAITKEKMGMDYLGSISINGTKISGRGSDLNLVAGDGLSLSYDPVASAILFSATGNNGTVGKGANAMSSDNYIINETSQESGANFNISGSGTIGTSLTVGGTSTLKGAVTIGTSSGTTPGQIIIDDGHSSSTKTATITGASQYGDNRTYTLSDVGANADFVMTQGNQSISGTKTFSSATINSGTASLSSLSVSGPVTLGTTSGTPGQIILNDSHSGYTRTATITGASEYGSNRTYTVPDVGSNADFVMTQGNQSVHGTKTFSSAEINSGDATLSSLIVNSNYSCDEHANARINGGFRVNGCETVTGDLTASDDLWVGDDLTASDRLRVYGNTTLNGLTVNDASSFGSDVTIAGSLTTANLIATTSVIPSTDNTVSLGDPQHRFKDLYLGSNSLVMTGDDDQTTFSVDPSGLTITQANADGTVIQSTTTIAADGTVQASNVSADADFTAGGAITSGNSITIDGSATPRSIEGDLTTNIWTDAGDILLNPAGNVGIGISYPTQPAYLLDVNGTFHASGNATFSSGLTVTGSSTLGAITGTPISGSTGSFTTLSSSGAATLNSLVVTTTASIGGALDMTGNAINNVAEPNDAQDAATKNYVDNLGASQTSALNAETTRAEAAESGLTTDLSTEVTRATTAESTLTTDLNNEVSRAEAAESGLTTDLNNEVSRATSAESTLTTNLNYEISRATSAESTLTTNLNNEISRAESAESTLTTNLNNEISRATSAESTLTANLTGEISRAEGAESTLTTNLSTEVSRATGAEGTITSTVNANDAAAVHKSGDETISGAKTFSGKLILSTESDAAASDNTVTLSGNAATATVTVGSSSTNVTASVTNGTAGQILYVYNALGNAHTVSLNGSAIADGKIGVFVYLNGDWRGQ